MITQRQPFVNRKYIIYIKNKGVLAGKKRLGKATTYSQERKNKKNMNKTGVAAQNNGRSK